MSDTTRQIEYKDRVGGKITTQTITYDAIMTMTRFAELDTGIVAHAICDGVSISRDFYLDVNDTDVLFCGGDGIVHGVKKDERVFVQFSNLQYYFDKITAMQENIDSLIKASLDE